MNSLYSQATDDLLSNGYAFVPVDAVTVSNAMGATRMLMDSIGEDDRWTLTRSGELEPDVGFIRKSKSDGFDEKAYFHFARDLPLLLEFAGVRESVQQKACLQMVELLHRELRDLALAMIDELERRSLVEPDSNNSMLKTFRLTDPYNTSVLRYLQYPDTKNQTGAKDHYDKGFFSIHLGDDGGRLYALDQSDRWIGVSPPPGMALVFFGVKALYASNGTLLPLRHKSVTVPGKVRTAMVMFAHADVGHQVVSAQDSHDEFYKTQ